MGEENSRKVNAWQYYDENNKAVNHFVLKFYQSSFDSFILV